MTAGVFVLVVDVNVAGWWWRRENNNHRYNGGCSSFRIARAGGIDGKPMVKELTKTGGNYSFIEALVDFAWHDSGKLSHARAIAHFRPIQNNVSNCRENEVSCHTIGQIHYPHTHARTRTLTHSR